MTGRVRPGRPIAPIVGVVLVLTAWYLVAHDSGDGWVQTIGDAVFALLTVGIVGPGVILARSKLYVASNPGDSTVGRPVKLAVESSTRLRIRPIDPPGPEVFVGPVRRGSRRRGGGQEEIMVIPAWRGTYDSVMVSVATASPFGLQWWTRKTDLSLPSTLHAAPRQGNPLPSIQLDDEDEGISERLVPSDSGNSRGVRLYRPGDPPSHVHWPASAHSATLMVREIEGTAAEPVIITVELPTNRENAERVAEAAMATMMLLLDDQTPVTLATLETSGESVASVADRIEAGRRLARAVPSVGAAGEGGIRVARWD